MQVVGAAVLNGRTVLVPGRLLMMVLAGGVSCALPAGVVLVGGCGGLCGWVLPAVRALIPTSVNVLGLLLACCPACVCGLVLLVSADGGVC